MSRSALNGTGPNWTALPDQDLLRHCEEDFFRSGGPGGQKRNKTASGVRLTHRPTGISVKATESRSQSENRARALRRLRWALALEVRQPVNLTGYRLPEEVRAYMDASGRIRINERNDQWPLIANHVLNLLAACEGRVGDAARLMGTSTGRLSQFLTENGDVRAEANRIRQSFSLKSLSARH